MTGLIVRRAAREYAQGRADAIADGWTLERALAYLAMVGPPNPPARTPYGLGYDSAVRDYVADRRAA